MRTGIRWLLAMKAACGGTLYEHTITNNPATFTTEVAKKLKGFTIPFTPVQSGSGDPAPDNVRAITGWTGLSIYQSGEDTSNPETTAVSWSTGAGTVYGGELNVLTGVLTVGWGIVDLGTFEWEEKSQFFALKNAFTDIKKIASTSTLSSLVCDSYKTATGAALYNGSASAHSIGQDDSTQTKIRITKDGYESADALKTALDGVMMAYELRNPTTVQLDPVTVTALVGENNIWTNTNGDNTIKYLSKTKPVGLGGGFGGGFGSGTETPSEPEEPSEEPGE